MLLWMLSVFYHSASDCSEEVENKNWNKFNVEYIPMGFQ